MTKRIAIIEKEKCNPIGCGNFLCIRLCPVNKTGAECIVESEDEKALIYENLCTGCGICPKRCPYDAIQIVNLPEKLNQDPMHRFGVNSFELFSLPYAKENVVVGVVGRNGIGKSTALSILAGLLNPNLGKYDQQISKEEILNKYSGSVLGDYFKKLFNDELVVSYKPQRVELLSKTYNETVKELLEKIDEKGIYEMLLKELELTSVLDRSVSNLSGGELQRLAIIAAACKKAHVYYFDEPTTFCDITHRIKVAKLIRSLAENAAVIVVEHDLAILDYISDEIQIFYGQASCYGIVSNSKSVRRGINEYLDGFLDDDNIRFRDYSIKFHDTMQERFVQDVTLVEYPSFKKSFKNFSLNVTKGRLRKGEVLAVMGANGLGKSTFLNVLSGKLNSDEGKVLDLNVSYKEQYLNSENESTVEEFLKEKAKTEYNSGWYKTNILEKLNVQSILQRQIKHLSGGELQKVFVAASLSGDVDLILLDEPSAFIDVEDRLKVAEVIKEFVTKKEISAIVIDHDIQFIDYLADTMLVFEGESGVKSSVFGPVKKVDGMNKVLKILDITYRKDKENHRPRINKLNSQLDREQREKGMYYHYS